MSSKLPPLNALRAFEAAVRLESFVKAADELFVTPAAVAQQIKVLEAWAGAKFFERKAQGVILTPIGESIRPDLIDAFDHLGRAAQRLRSISAPNQIQIAALPSIAQFWLSPLLPGIRNALPGTAISVSAQDKAPNMKRNGFDLCIYFEEEPQSEFSTILEQDVIFPICAPSLLKTIRDKQTQQTVTLFHDSLWDADWREWLGNSKEMHRTDLQGPEFSLYSLAVEEVKNGAGALIGHQCLVGDLLSSGAVVMPFKRKVKLPRWLTIKVSDSVSEHSTIKKIVSYLEKQSAK
ncbi:MAG: DNA-binding transcriptional LysR family regulator [Saprospiraceae bacterium]|jgi:DNA-binding transcriptional LysR family regulator